MRKKKLTVEQFANPAFRNRNQDFEEIVQKTEEEEQEEIQRYLDAHPALDRTAHSEAIQRMRTDRQRVPGQVYLRAVYASGYVILTPKGVTLENVSSHCKGWRKYSPGEVRESDKGIVELWLNWGLVNAIEVYQT